MSRIAALFVLVLASGALGADPPPLAGAATSPPAAPAPAAPPSLVPAAPGTSAPMFATPRRVVSLKEALELAAKNSPDLAAAKARADQVVSQANQVWGALLPEISANGSVVHTSAPATFAVGQFIGLVGGVYALTPANPSLIPSDIDIIGENSTYGGVVVTQTLITPQMVLIPAADDGVQSAHLGTLEAREQVLLATARLYLSIKGIAQLEAAAHDAETVALKREKDAKNQLAVGMAVEVNLLRAQAETAQARSTLAQLAGQREALLSLLESFTAEPVRPDQSDGLGLDVGTPADEANQPWESTYLIRSEKKGYEALSAFHLYDRLLWMPTLAAQVKGNYNSNTGFTGQNLSWDASLMLYFPIYDRGARYSAMHEDDAKAAEALAKLEGDRRRAKATWVGAKTNLAAAQAALVEAEAQLSLATRAQKQLESAYQAGVATSLELSDMDTKRFLAASATAQARAQVQVREVEVAASEGRLAAVAGLK
jgi:outer membrane protein